MASTRVLLNSNLNAKIITASVNFIGNGYGLLNIPRSTGIAIGNANYVLINNGSGIMTEEQYLNVSRGGTGIDTSLSSGIARVTNGVWSIGYNLVNSDIDQTAEIDRSKIKLGSLNHVIINDNIDGHLTSEA